MGRKVFVSYKYGDTNVPDLNKKDVITLFGHDHFISRPTKVRDYVDELQKLIGTENINLGEKDGESLAEFSDDTIVTTLKKRIAQCSITIVMISKGMKTNEPEKDQWIPREVSYSLRSVPFKDFTKQMNGVLGIVLPDETGTYDWYYTENPQCNSTTHNTYQLFKILKNNMFNIIEKKFKECNGTNIHITDEPSFIKTVRWDTFIYSTNNKYYIEKAIEIKNNKDLYKYIVNLED